MTNYMKEISACFTEAEKNEKESFDRIINDFDLTVELEFISSLDQIDKDFADFETRLLSTKRQAI